MTLILKIAYSNPYVEQQACWALRLEEEHWCDLPTRFWILHCCGFRMGKNMNRYFGPTLYVCIPCPGCGTVWTVRADSRVSAGARRRRRRAGTQTARGRARRRPARTPTRALWARGPAPPPGPPTAPRHPPGVPGAPWASPRGPGQRVSVCVRPELRAAAGPTPRARSSAPREARYR